VSLQGRWKQCEAAGAAISKGHLLLSHHFSGRQYLLKLYCMDTESVLIVLVDCKVCFDWFIVNWTSLHDSEVIAPGSRSLF
jgi:hypothetical protein